MPEQLYTPFCIRTSSGEYINVGDIKPEQILAYDIAIGLARECRFGNFTRRFYSVAEHSIWCMQRAEELHPDNKALHLAVLLHDAHEAYLGDWCTPMVDAIDKSFGGFAEVIKTVKLSLQLNIHLRFGIAEINPMDDRIKEIDRMALEYEWENKVLAWSGFPPLGDIHVADMWMTYLKKLVKVPVFVAK